MKLRPVDEILDEFTADPAGVMRKYAKNPREFCKDILRVNPLEWQAEFMQAVSDARFGLPNDTDSNGNPVVKVRFAIKSGTGVGKTMCVASLILWHLACFRDTKIPCTAPTSPQIKAVLWPELRKWANNIPDKLKPYFPYDVQTDSVKLLENMAIARTAREESPEGFQGFHSHNILLVADEASGVPDSIFLAGQGVMSSKGAITILIGNPTRPNGWFFDAFHNDSHLYWTRTINCTMSSMVQPQYVEEMRNKHGEDSYEFQVRVMGEFHLEASGFVVPRSLVTAAMNREVEPDTDYIIWGIDVSAGGKDKSAVAKRMGNTLLEPVQAWGGLDVSQFVDTVVEMYHNTPERMRPDEICVEVTGVGHGFLSQLKRELAIPAQNGAVMIRGINVAERKARQERFTSLSVELWSKTREWFETLAVKFPDDPETYNQLCSVEWEVNPNNGKWQLLGKHTKGVSPDKADAFKLTFAGRQKTGFTRSRRNGRFEKPKQELYGITSASYIN